MMVTDSRMRSRSRADKKIVDTNDYGIFASPLSSSAKVKAKVELARKLRAAKQQAINAKDVSPMRSRR